MVKITSHILVLKPDLVQSKAETSLFWVQQSAGSQMYYIKGHKILLKSIYL